jgi:hypothetical protein
MIKATKLDAYADCEGRGTRYSGIFTNPEDARKVHMSGYQNALMCAPREIDLEILMRPVHIYESVGEFLADNPNISDAILDTLVPLEKRQELLRARARAKLTDEELRALHLL